uniref:PSP1 C-terminal domain-containing protein n=1 Tax=Trypanosoma vivax (strain Y486) TaxID=1055687 RepID=G0U8Y3_TRYVY|nr:conserved hypothetical protein [Trypanosoma vivax Y486]
MDFKMFQDMTNATQTKRQTPLDNAIDAEARSSENMCRIQMGILEALMEKVDILTRKVDGLYAMLHMLQQNAVHSSVDYHPPAAQMAASDLVQRVLSEEENNHVTYLNNAIPRVAQIPQVYESPSYAPLVPTVVDKEATQSAGVKCTEEEVRKGGDRKVATAASSTLAQRSDDANNWKKRDCFIVLVEFKCQRVKRCESSTFITPGQYAIVQGDRGHDCGVVNQCSEWNAEKGAIVREESFEGIAVSVLRMKGELGRVLRVATEEEVERLFGEISRNENLALKTCREVVSRLGLDMDVVDCEYQFDQQKISFYYEASRSIDFRQLNSELFRIFGVRIWLQNVNNAVKNVVPAGAMSRDEKTQYQKSGLRPPTFK